MGKMFIEVTKVVEKKKKAEDGSEVRNPLEKGTPVQGGYDFFKETIRVDEIRSARHWDKSSDQEAYIETDLTIIYLKGDGKRESRPNMLLLEKYSDFSKRLQALEVNG